MDIALILNAADLLSAQWCDIPAHRMLVLNDQYDALTEKKEHAFSFSMIFSLWSVAVNTADVREVRSFSTGRIGIFINGLYLVQELRDLHHGNKHNAGSVRADFETGCFLTVYTSGRKFVTLIKADVTDPGTLFGAVKGCR